MFSGTVFNYGRGIITAYIGVVHVCFKQGHYYRTFRKMYMYGKLITVATALSANASQT